MLPEIPFGQRGIQQIKAGIYKDLKSKREDVVQVLMTEIKNFFMDVCTSAMKAPEEMIARKTQQLDNVRRALATGFASEEKRLYRNLQEFGAPDSRYRAAYSRESTE